MQLYRMFSDPKSPLDVKCLMCGHKQQIENCVVVYDCSECGHGNSANSAAEKCAEDTPRDSEGA